MTNIIYVDDDEETLISLNNLGFYFFNTILGQSDVFGTKPQYNIVRS